MEDVDLSAAMHLTFDELEFDDLYLSLATFTGSAWKAAASGRPFHLGAGRG